MANQTVVTSPGPGKLNSRDFLRGLLVAVIASVLTIVADSVNEGSLSFDWKLIGITALTSGLAYIIKNLGTPAEVVLVNPTPSQIETAKKEDATVTVKPS